jgi:AcrR family transcriptional regulator
MSASERREQLVAVGRALFAERGYEGASMEEVAARAGVSKPVVYEHFGSKELLYRRVVEEETAELLRRVTAALLGPSENSRDMLETAASALLGYIEEHRQGFRILVRDRAAPGGTGTYASLMNDIASRVDYVLAGEFRERGFDPSTSPMYAQMLVGMISQTGLWWLDAREPEQREVLRHIVTLAWNGLASLDQHPVLRPERQALPDALPARGPDDR